MIAAARCAHRTPRRSRSRRVGNRKRAQRVSRNGPIIGCLVTALGLPTVADPVAAQERELRSYGAGAPEAKLMVFYSSIHRILAHRRAVGRNGACRRWPFRPVARSRGPSSRSRSRTFLGFPRTSVRSGPTSPSRPTSLPCSCGLGSRSGCRGGLGLEGSWIPPFRVFDVKANVLSAARVARVRRRVGCPPNAASFRSHGARRRADHLQPGQPPTAATNRS